MRERAEAMDALRGLSMLAVVVLHLTGRVLDQQQSFHGPALVFLAINVGTRFAVPLFIVLSGAGIVLSRPAGARPGYWQFLARRLSKILPAYVGWSLAYDVFGSQRSGPLSVSLILSDLAGGHASYHLYFVPLVVRLYLLAPLLEWCAASGASTALCCLASWTRILWGPHVNVAAIDWLVVDLVPLRYVGYFVLGIWLARNVPLGGVRLTAATASTEISAAARFLHRHGSHAAWLSAALWGVISLLVFRLTAVRADTDEALDAIEVLIMPYALAVTGAGLGRVWSHTAARVLGFLSVHSYGIYLAHVLVLEVTFGLLARLGHPASGTGYLVVGLALGLPAAVLASATTGALGRLLRKRLARS